MRTLVCLALASLTNLIAASASSAADFPAGAPEAAFSWRLTFGGSQSPKPAFSLALGYRDLDTQASGQVLEWDVSERSTRTRLMGMPLLERDHRVAQNNNPAEELIEPTPWYTRPWVLWTAGGLAATAALAGGGGGGGDDSQDINVVSSESDGDVCAVSGVPGAPDVCAAPEGQGFAENLATTSRFAPRTSDAWLDAGTGHMGDLLAR